jgi:putative oxidoreductase
MKYAIIVVRILLGLAFVVFGLNGFLHFIPGSDKVPTGIAGDFTKAMFASGYFYPIAALQIAGGALLLVGRFVALGLVILGPIVVNIVMFHYYFDRANLPMALVFAGLTAFLIWGYRERFAGVFRA